MFNPLNNPLVVRTVLDKAQEELNEALRYRKKQFNNPNLYMWVEIDQKENIPYISLRNELGADVVRMTAEQLLEDEAIKQQLKKIPALVRPFINFNKIIPVMSKKLIAELGANEALKVMEGPKTALIERWKGNEILKKDVDLYQVFG